MTRKQRILEAIDYLGRTLEATETELNYTTPFELLIAVMLSAQCTDKRINEVTPRLFAAYPTPESLAQATPDEVLTYIKSVSYPNNKARHLVGMAKRLVEAFNSEVPTTLEELTTLPGVGRKTANVVQAVAFGKAALAVDTHVFRVSHRLKLVPTTATTPYAVEMALRKYIPEHLVAPSHYWLLLHGRYTCTARKPHCDQCGLAHICPTIKKKLADTKSTSTIERCGKSN
ncbi:MAG: endonuclease III [Bacteroidaceae bacterium]|nr:endonuclease III [Bacteroidaceae bacterium]